MVRLLLISNSTNAGEAYLEHPKKEIEKFLGSIKRVLFIPWAPLRSATMSMSKRFRNDSVNLGLRLIQYITIGMQS